jgi:EAL domain-containing protein (putative c-di-GMP-specific phosphodiesterase class I)
LFGDIRIAVNVASKQLERGGFASKLIERLAVAGVSPDVIELEITERALLTFSSQTLQAFTVLRQSGVSIALDDFGIGYSALAYLRRFPIDKIKIDRLFVREIGKPGNQADLVEAILGIARAMQIDVIAEGVDSMEQAIHLRDKGCYEVQGFLISRPLPVVLVERLLSTVRAGYDWEKKGFFRDSKSAQG